MKTFKTKGSENDMELVIGNLISNHVPLNLAELHVFVLRSIIEFIEAPTNLMKLLPNHTMF